MYRGQTSERNVQGKEITSERNVQGKEVTSEGNVQRTDITCKRNTMYRGRTLHIKGMQCTVVKHNK